MKRYCERIRNAVGERGPQALSGDEAAQEHVAGCEECFAFLEAAAQLEAELAAIEPIDAPDAVVERLFERVETAAELSPRGRRGRWIPSSGVRMMATLAEWWTLRHALAAGLFVVVMSGLLVLVLPERARMAGEGSASTRPASEPEPRRLRAVAEVQGLEQTPAGSVPVTEGRRGNAPPPAAPPAQRRLARMPATEPSATGVAGGSAWEKGIATTPEAAEPPPAFDIAPPRPAAKAVPEEESYAAVLGDDDLADLESALEVPEPLAGREADPFLVEGRYAFSSADENRDLPARQSGIGTVVGQTGGEADEALATSAQDKKRRKEDSGGEESRLGKKAKDEELLRTREDGHLVAADEITVTGEAAKIVETTSSAASATVGPAERARWAARAFLNERRTVDGLTFQEANGYWANTYVPGDPLLRLLDSRLAQRDRSSIEPFASFPIVLHDAARQAVQPFDPPQDSALGVYLSADRAALEGEGRMVLQVGLEATPRRSGRRGAMNVALVLDLRRPLDVESAAAMRALVFALAAARDVGDRFHIVVAGRPGGLLIGPDGFRHGPLAVTLEELLAAPAPQSPSSRADRRPGTDQEPGPTLDLDAATVAAIDAVTNGDDPSAPLGSSVVVLVTAQPLAGSVERLEELAHTSAVGGVPVSVVGVGADVVRGELDRLALAGQGTRRLLTRPADAEALVESELTAASRVVARAVRLRIRLARGVRLVDVLGSHRLDEPSADRVREAEQSIDRRLARSLGIEADRGEDEEGIQIVIPSLYAGDSHVVLLDVVAPGPGPVAEVTVRFKDLVFLRNGVGRAQLALERGERERGPLQLNVLQNLLALRLYGGLEAAGLALARGDARAAADRIAEMRTLLEGVALEVRELGGDRDLERDRAMLDEYLALVGSDLDADGRIYLAESLRLAGRLKVLPRPTALGGGR